MNILLAQNSKGQFRSKHRKDEPQPPSMTVIGSAQPDVIKVKVYRPKMNGGEKNSDLISSKIFCIDPRISSFRTMQYLISQAFQIESDFTLSAVEKCPTTGEEKSTFVWSDLDLDMAIKKVKPGSYLRLRYDLVANDEGLDDWDFVPSADINSNIRWFNVNDRSIIATVVQNKNKPMSTLNKTINRMYGGHDRHSVRPVTEKDYRKFIDDEGRLIRATELRQAIYEAGIDPSFRRTIWMHLLNIFPNSMTSVQRKVYLDNVTKEYHNLKKRWQDEKCRNQTLSLLISKINGDVLRTDRTISFYASSGDANVNLQTMLRILVTYSYCHPQISYCQGMNDYVSVLLFVMRDEALTYLCFCSIMKRIRGNFATDGVAIATKFYQMKMFLRAIDPVYWDFFESSDAVNLYFAYRWLLLECKREFPFQDALRVLEVMWATLPIENKPPALSEYAPLGEKTLRTPVNRPQMPYCRRSHRRALSCPPRFISKPFDSFNVQRNHSLSIAYPRRESFLNSMHMECNGPLQNEEFSYPIIEEREENSASASSKSREKSVENSFSISEISEFDFNQSCARQITTTDFNSVDWLHRLSICDASWMDDENLFLLFLCVSILLTHRKHLLKRKHLDEQEISMHFNSYCRRHRAERLLDCARTLYGQYLQWTRKKRMLDDLNSFSAS